MSTYCTKQDILDEFKGLDIQATGTSITDAQVTEWIAQESNYIDAKISLRYVVPFNLVTYPIAASVLKRIAIFRVGERVKNKIEVKSNITQKDSEEKYTQNYVRTPNYDLEQIVKGNLSLPGVPLVVANGSVDSSCIECDTSTCHVIDVGSQQW